MISKLFLDDEFRVKKYSFELNNILFDFSKQRISNTDFNNLLDMLDEIELKDKINALFSRKEVNYTENRRAMHWLLRSKSDDSEEFTQIRLNLEKMYSIIDMINSNEYRGITGEKIKDIVNIGVGGSDLGPLMVCRALKDYNISPCKIHFVSTMDGSQLHDLLDTLRPETTLFVISSKSFSTPDTMSNANTVYRWMLSYFANENFKNQHFIGITSNKEKAMRFGIPESKCLDMWEWVGGRYSLWSCIGFPIALMVGKHEFESLLKGARLVDDHFRITPFNENIPVIMALIGYFNSNIQKIKTHAVLPYDGRLEHFHRYLQQLEMESNGKYKTYPTSPIIWGEVGPNAQHAFYQLLHQGTHEVSCDFIVCKNRYHNNSELEKQHKMTLANCFAQSRLLAFGTNDDRPSHKIHRGNQPSTTIMLDSLDAFSLGSLIAIYEHKTYVQSIMWDINAFDQWGVEEGKIISESIIKMMDSSNYKNLDESTIALIEHVKKEI